MQERELRDLIAEVKDGRLSRRTFVQKMIAVGLTAPMAGMMLAHSGVAMAQPRSRTSRPRPAAVASSRFCFGRR